MMTEERGRKKTKPEAVEEKVEDKSASFRARKMPSYKFFEVAKASDDGAPKEPQFVPFNLQT